MDTQTQREKYIRSGRVDWLHFIPWLFIIFVTCLALACFLNWAYRSGAYYVLIFPIFAGCGVGGLVYLAVRFGHCRSRLVTVLTGLLAGALVYLGYFQAGLVSELGPEAITRVDLLPRYIQFRMNSDAIVDANHETVVGRRKPLESENGSTDDQAEPPKNHLSGKSIENWLTFAFEFIAVLVCAVGFGFARSRKAYCERCRKWMDQELAVFLPGHGSGFLAAFNSGQFSVFTDARIVPLLQNTPYTAAVIDFCAPARGRVSACPVYFSVKEVRAASVGQPGQFDNTRGEEFLDRVKLNATETAGLSSRFPILSALTGVAPPATPAFAAAPVSAPSGLSLVPPVATVQVKPSGVSPESRILSRKNILIGNALTLGILVVFFGGIVGVLGGAILVVPDGSPQHLPHSALQIATGIALIVCGLPAAIVGAVIGLRNPGLFGNRYLLNLCRRSFQRRSEHLLDLKDPELVFVQVIPRKNWGRAMLETAEDIGFIHIDPQRREILFEGDRDCIRIPADAITSCTVEQYVAGGDQRATIVYSITIIGARAASGPWELPFSIRWTSGKVNNDRRYQAACELQQQILALAPSAA